MIAFISLFFMVLCKESLPVKIQELSTKKYLKSRGSGPVSLVTERSEATDFVLEDVTEDNLNLIIREDKSKKVLDFAGGKNKVIIYAKHGGRNQQFTLILDSDGNHQIKQADNNKYIYYDSKSEELLGAPFSREKHVGFIISRDEEPLPDPEKYFNMSNFPPLLGGGGSYSRSWNSTQKIID